MKDYRHMRILKVTADSAVDADDVIAIEKKVKISVNGRHVLSLYCTPLMIREFTAGVIHNEGLISGSWCAERMSIDYGDEILVDVPADGTLNEGEKTVTSGCAGGISFSRAISGTLRSDRATFPAGEIRDIFHAFQRRSEVYRQTGGVHSAALTDGRTILAFAEDIGRHNAVDKVIGFCLLEQISFEGRIMLASGRLSSEIVSKCARSGIPVIVSRAAPTSLAVEIAESAGVTLIGFMRGDRMNVYSGRQRVIV